MPIIHHMEEAVGGVLQGEVELVDSFQEGEVRISSRVLQSRLLPSCYSFSQQESQEIPHRHLELGACTQGVRGF